jgi:hypothetical protein
MPVWNLLEDIYAEPLPEFRHTLLAAGLCARYSDALWNRDVTAHCLQDGFVNPKETERKPARFAKALIF